MVRRGIDRNNQRHKRRGMKVLARFVSFLFIGVLVLASLLLLYFYTLFWTNLLGDKGFDVAFLTAPGIYISPFIYWIHDGYFPTVGFELLGICIASAVISVFLWSRGRASNRTLPISGGR